MPPKHAAKQQAAPVHGRNDDDLDTNWEQSRDFEQASGSEAESDSGSEDEGAQAKAKAKAAKKKPASSSDSDSNDDMTSKPHSATAAAKSAAATPAAAAPSGKVDTSKPPVRAAAVPQKLAKTKPGEAPKQLTKQQINQIAAREKQKAEAEKKARQAAILGGAPAAAAAAKPAADKKRKQPAAAASSDSDSDSDAEPQSKAQKASAAATPAASAATAAAAAAPTKHLVDTTGMSEKEAKAAILEAKRAARAAKKDARRAAEEAAGTHPTQLDLQLMGRELAAAKLWDLYATDRRDRGAPLTAIESDELGGPIPPQSLAQLPQHDRPEGHDFAKLPRALRSMYPGSAADFQQQVCGGVIQPAMSTKSERFQKKRSQAERAEADADAADEMEEEAVQQKARHIEDPSIGAPYIVIISGSAIRAVELGRAFKKIQMNTRVVKLFAKHIKMDEQREELSHDVRVVIGTPHRLLKLSTSGFLKWSRVKLIIWDIGKTRKLQMAEKQQQRRIKNKIKKGEHVDNPHIVEVRADEKGSDHKMFTLITMKDTKTQLWQLYEQFLADVLVKKQTAKLVLL